MHLSPFLPLADMDVSLFGAQDEWQAIIKRLSAEPIDAISALLPMTTCVDHPGLPPV